jgi:hypothetical protein
MGANKDAKDTKQTAMLLAEAIEGFQELFIDTANARLGSGPTLSFKQWDKRKQESIVLRANAVLIANKLESRIPQRLIDKPAFRDYPHYLFYVASRRGLARQFSAVDMSRIANDLLWVGAAENEADIAAAAAERANQLGRHALFLLQAAPTLTSDAASVQKVEALSSSLEKSYGKAKAAMEQALAAIERVSDQ